MDLMNLKISESPSMLQYMGFNQDHGCFALGTTRGFQVFNTYPMKERFRRDFGEDGGIRWVEMLYRCNILALVGGGGKSRFTQNKVMVWDDYQNKCIVELEFRSDVKAVKLRRDKIVVVLETRVYVYNFSDVKLIHQIDTIENSKGIVALCPNSTNSVLAVPGLKKGFVHVELYDYNKTTIIQAHENVMSCIALNLEGTRLATASEKGTLIRIFDTLTGQLLQEVRRGADKAEIYSINFSFNSDWLCVSSDKSTIHVFSLEKTEVEGAAVYDSEQVTNPKHTLHFMKGFSKYFGSQRSFVQFRVPNESRSICAFGPEKNSVVVICSDGSYYKSVFDPLKGGEVKECTFTKYVNTDDG